MNKKVNGEIARIEAAQKALQESIEVTKNLAKEAETLLQKHKQTLKDQSPS
jgi:hypothetical protein